MKQISRQNNSQVTPLLQKDGGHHRVDNNELIMTERNSLNIDKNDNETADHLDHISPKLNIKEHDFPDVTNNYYKNDETISLQKNRNPAAKKEPLRISMK